MLYLTSLCQVCVPCCATPTATTATVGASATLAGRGASARSGTRSARCRTATATGGASREGASAQGDSPGSSARKVSESVRLMNKAGVRHSLLQPAWRLSNAGIHNPFSACLSLAWTLSNAGVYNLFFSLSTTSADKRALWH